MAAITIVGDGPAGLSAALFLARGDQDVIVIGTDDTPMHYAHLHNYLGIDETPGPEFQARARAQVAAAGARLVNEEATSVTTDGDGYAVHAGTQRFMADYVVLAAGKAGSSLARELGATVDTTGPDVDGQYRTTVDCVYAIGRLARPDRSQAIISAGAGAVAALDILAREAGKHVVDWDSLDD